MFLHGFCMIPVFFFLCSACPLSCVVFLKGLAWLFFHIWVQHMNMLLWLIDIMWMCIWEEIKVRWFSFYTLSILFTLFCFALMTHFSFYFSVRSKCMMRSLVRLFLWLFHCLSPRVVDSFPYNGPKYSLGTSIYPLYSSFLFHKRSNGMASVAGDSIWLECPNYLWGNQLYIIISEQTDKRHCHNELDIRAHVLASSTSEHKGEQSFVFPCCVLSCHFFIVICQSIHCPLTILVWLLLHLCCRLEVLIQRGSHREPVHFMLTFPISAPKAIVLTFLDARTVTDQFFPLWSFLLVTFFSLLLSQHHFLLPFIPYSVGVLFHLFLVIFNYSIRRNHSWTKRSSSKNSACWLPSQTYLSNQTLRTMVDCSYYRPWSNKAHRIGGPQPP